MIKKCDKSAENKMYYIKSKIYPLLFFFVETYATAILESSWRCSNNFEPISVST